MVESIEHFCSKLQLHTFSDSKRLDKPEIHIPVTRRRKDVPACAFLAWCRKTKRLREIYATGSQRYRLEQNWAGEGLTWQFL
jgi:hypothetical protein